MPAITACELFSRTDCSKIVLEKDGSQIVDDEILVECVSDKEILMVLRSNEYWSPVIEDKNSNPEILNLEDLNVINNSFINSLCHNSPGSSNSRSSIVEVIDLTVPWHKIPNNIMESCQKGEKLSVSAYNLFVAIVVDQARETDRYTQKKNFAARAKSIMEKYPQTFMDIDEDGTLIGDGSCSLLMKLIHRNNYLNRPHKSSFAQQLFKKNVQAKSFRQKQSGSVNWQPDVPENCNIDDNKEYLLLGATDPRCDQTKLLELFKETFPQQRLEINGGSSVSQMMQNWPIMFEEKYLLHHFGNLVNIDVNKCLEHCDEKMKVISLYIVF